MGQGAVVLLITDGLDRDDAGALEKEMERLHLSARRLIWLNPLLRWDGFAPKATASAPCCPMWTASAPAIPSSLWRIWPARSRVQTTSERKGD